MKKSKYFFSELYGNEKPGIEDIEKDFWEICHNKQKDLKVRYAADLPYKTFLSNGNISEIIQELNKNKTWNLLSLYGVKNSLFRFLDEGGSHRSHISGLTIPWIYLGMLFSTFCWHVEDLYLYSVNYLYQGGSKIWYGISHLEKTKMDDFIQKEYGKQDDEIHHKLILLVDPNKLIANGITVYKTEQKPGEIILTLPKAYHAGFSTGFNVAEAVNLAVKVF